MSVNAEQNVLGAILVDNNIFDKVDFLDESDFINYDHQMIFSISKRLISEGKEVDFFIINDELKDISLKYLTDLSRGLPTTKNAKAYADVIKRESTNRKLMAASTLIHQLANEDGDVKEKLDTALDLINKLADSPTDKSKPKPVKDFIQSTLDRIEDAYNNDGSLIGLSTGLNELDKKTLGFHKSDLIIIAGRPSMGKTSLALNMAEHCALEGKTALVFSMEMGAEQLTQRELSSLSSISLNDIRSGNLGDDTWARLSSAVTKLNTMPLIIDETPALTVGDIRLRAKQVKRERGLDLIVIDYIQLMSGSGNNRNEAVSEISRGLKAIAKELQVPVIALSQLNRNLDTRTDKHPQMSDLRDSGAIEQDADVILFVYRDEVYNEESQFKGLAEVVIGKQRQGELGKIVTEFKGHLCRFNNYSGVIPDYQPKGKGFKG